MYPKSQGFDIDFRSWYVDQEDFLAKFWASKREIQEEWQIDLSNLDIKNVVANGAYGTLYKGVYNGREVAMKILGNVEDGHTTTAEAFALLQSFYRQVAVMQHLSHPNVIQFHGASVGISGLKIPSKENSMEPSPSKACCVVLEYIPGETLRKHLIRNSRNKLTRRKAFKLALDLARGLSYLHSKNIVHRNFTTENILLDIYGRPKIAGFRLARFEAQNHRDKTGDVGTPGYIAPEVLEGKSYNRKCDIYSFGICVWEIFSCDTPYADLRSSEVLSSVVQQKLRPKFSKNCPSWLASIIKKCWDEDSEKRPEMKEVVEMLETLLEEDEDNDWWRFTPTIRGSFTPGYPYMHY
uniref:serine/threonine-protein kinase STY13-like n=1 Tax=Erigeron canadensis TaxID=72917 RepID=UPI001CB8A4A5|nr:serine/threonine-protein kinase STY13-like [Erigeron canadensis]